MRRMDLRRLLARLQGPQRFEILTSGHEALTKKPAGLCCATGSAIGSWTRFWSCVVGLQYMLDGKTLWECHSMCRLVVFGCKKCAVRWRGSRRRRRHLDHPTPTPTGNVRTFLCSVWHLSPYGAVCVFCVWLCLCAEDAPCDCYIRAVTYTHTASGFSAGKLQADLPYSGAYLSAMSAGAGGSLRR